MCLKVREIQGQNRTAPLMKKSRTSLLAMMADSRMIRFPHHSTVVVTVWTLLNRALFLAYVHQDYRGLFGIGMSSIIQPTHTDEMRVYIMPADQGERERCVSSATLQPLS